MNLTDTKILTGGCDYMDIPHLLIELCYEISSIVLQMFIDLFMLPMKLAKNGPFYLMLIIFESICLKSCHVWKQSIIYLPQDGHQDKNVTNQSGRTEESNQSRQDGGLREIDNTEVVIISIIAPWLVRGQWSVRKDLDHLVHDGNGHKSFSDSQQSNQNNCTMMFVRVSSPNRHCCKMSALTTPPKRLLYLQQRARRTGESMTPWTLRTHFAQRCCASHGNQLIDLTRCLHRGLNFVIQLSNNQIIKSFKLS